ncbi:MAG: FAD:protein FMN transferase [Melioribacteraceae bacterium]|nr:FAD:protein FMN transferase [Melioribacteraceae bacterium]
MKKQLKNLLFLPLLFLFISCSNQDNSKELFTFTGSTMGTTYSIKIVEDSSVDKNSLITIKAEVDSVLKEVNRQMSTYIPTSEISVLNNAKKSKWVSISKDFAFVLSKSIEMGEESKGSLDITVGPLVNLWGFGPKEQGRIIPTDSEIIKTMNLTGLDKIEVRLDPPSAMKKIDEVYCDLSATAKGFGVDKVAEYLQSKGYKNFLVEIGGELYARGLNHKGEKWLVGISTPDHTGRVEYAIGLSNYAMATSGDYWNYFEENGVRYSHTIEPRTGKPITHKLASVTVLDSTCLMADGLATAIDVMGPEKGLEFATKRNLAIYMIVRKGEGFYIKKSPKFIELYDEKEKK